MLFLLECKGGTMDVHGILKLLFFADVDHLNRYGRPIIGDQYRALPYGPVAQSAYDILKGELLALEELDEDPLPIVREGRFMMRGQRAHNPALLSRSDLAALRTAFATYGHLDFRHRTDASHLHPAYSRAWEAGELVMRYEDFFEPANATAERLADLAAVGPLMMV